MNPVSNYNFHISYKLDHGFLIGTGVIHKGSQKFRVNLKVKVTEHATIKNIKNIQNAQLGQLIDSFRIGKRISKLELDASGNIASTPVGSTKAATPIPWQQYKQNVADSVERKKELLAQFKSHISDNTLLDEIEKIDWSHPKTTSRQIQSILDGYPQAVKISLDINGTTYHLDKILRSLQRKENRLITEEIFIHLQAEPTTQEKSDLSIESASPSREVKKTSKVGKAAITKGTSRIGKGMKSLKNLAHRVFLDGNAPWKQKKYELALQGIIQAFGADNLQNLCQFYEQRKNRSQLEQKTLDVLNILKNLDTFPDKRQAYRDFMTSLRNALEDQAYKNAILHKKNNPNAYFPQTASILLTLCQNRFTGVKIHSFLDTLIHGMIEKGEKALRKEGKETPLQERPLSEAQFEAIEAAPDKYKSPRLPVLLNNLSGHWNIGFDPHLKSNVPYVNYELSLDDKPISCLRIGTPTQETTGWSAAINPEFRAFLQGYEFMNKKHVYFSLQKSFGNEQNRTEAIKALEKEFPNTFVAVVLDQDSKFYNQKEAFADLNDYKSFKSAFLNEMNGPHFYISPALGTAFMEESQDLMDKLYEKGFATQPPKPFTVEERKDFIELYYALFELLVLKHEQPDSYNLSCKDAIDRGGKSNALLFQMILLLSGEDDTDPVRKRELETITHSPSMIVKQQTIISKHERRARLQNPTGRLQDPNMRPRFQSLAADLGIQMTATIHKDVNQANVEVF